MAADLRWVSAHLTPHPASTVYDHVVVGDPAAAAITRSYITCSTSGRPSHLAPFADRVRRDDWVSEQLAGGHLAMVTMPIELSALLVAQA